MPQKGIPSQKQKKWTARTTEFCIFKLVLVPNFSLNLQFWFSGPSLPKKGISSLNQKRWTTPLNSAYSNRSTYQISVWTDNFDFLDLIYLKRVYLVKTGKKWTTWILHIWNFQVSNFSFTDKIGLKRVFPVKNRKSEQHWVPLNSAYSN